MELEALTREERRTADLRSKHPRAETEKSKNHEGKRVGDVKIGFPTALAPAGRGPHIVGSE